MPPSCWVVPCGAGNIRKRSLFLPHRDHAPKISQRALKPTPPKQKNGSFLKSARCVLKHHKYRPKWPLGGVGLGQGAGAQKSRTPGGNLFLRDFLIIFDVAFLCKNLGTCIKHRKYRQKMRLRTRLELQKLRCF